MADNTLTTAASLLFEMRGPLQSLYPKDHVLLAEWSGVGNPDPAFGRVTPASSGQIERDNRDIFSGSRVRVPVDLNMLQGGGFPSETGTINVPVPASFNEAHINLVRVVQPSSITLDLDEDSMDNSAAQGLALLVKKTREALAEIINAAFNSTSGVGGLGLADSTQATAGGLTLTMKAGTNWDRLYPGKIVDVLTSASGADPGQGLRRLIASTSPGTLTATGTITFSTTQQASDGGSGNISLSNAVGVFLPGSYGNQPAGIEDAANISGSDTFESINRSTVSQWVPTDGRQGSTTVVPLSDAILDTGLVIGQRKGRSQYDFGIGDPNALNVYKNSKLGLVRIQPQTSTLPSGFSGVVWQGAGKDVPLVPERYHAVGSVKLLAREMATIYGRRRGPDFEDSTGAMFMRFSRALPREFWLVDRLQWGWHQPNQIVRFDNLATS